MCAGMCVLLSLHVIIGWSEMEINGVNIISGIFNLPYFELLEKKNTLNFK